jgi:predicted TIM-barrel fold metal-dependent hydrolase
MNKITIINVHTHLRKTDDVDGRVKLWRRCGCEKVCVHVTGKAEKDVRHNNESILPILKKYSDILLGFAKAEMGWEPSQADDIDKFKEDGFHGLKFIAPSYAYDSEKYFPLYERAEQLNMPVLFHTGMMSTVDNQKYWGISLDKMRAARLDTIARAFPKLRIMMPSWQS